MGWASGSDLLHSIYADLRQFIPKKQRVLVLAKLMYQFSECDCDTMHELFNYFPEARAAHNLMDEKQEKLYTDLPEENAYENKV